MVRVPSTTKKMSCISLWTCSGGPGKPGSILDSKIDTGASDFAVALNDSSEAPISRFSPSPGRKIVATIAANLSNASAPTATRLPT
jgi:hypothetical protein